jgi:putative sterol carrier protein
MKASEIFDKMKDEFIADEAEGVDAIFQFNISGDTGGDWFCEIKDKTCNIEQGKHDSPECTIIMEHSDFVAMMTGSLAPMEAFMSGSLKVEGDMMKAMLIQTLFQSN